MILIVARPLPGTVSETRRVAHLFPKPSTYPGQLIALCGAKYWSGDLEMLNGVRGMPCERCLARSPEPNGSIASADP
ncbi:MAG TPA: hypothetical protein VJT49_16690 [Amycolatopsis sp.]|uniref:hypothetical protein n=1 Tax=Amycolatopsis sp. TaxID=37632 RepID=UPI002B47FD3C|nr:hypothetical protein [Amycolatopsis sp.]HKS46712.1 hypothetical protein [Amycolatopsis sp.]